MNQPLENYVPPALGARFRRQAWKVWAGALALVAVWVLAIAAAPLARGGGFDGAAAALYGFFGHICHQMPERSFHAAGHPLAVCARCFGVYFGLLAGFALYPRVRRVEEIEPLPRFWLFLAMVPIGIDWSLGVFGLWENTHLSRFATGAILGAACGVFIVPALVEIFRLLTVPRRRARQ